MNDFDKGFEFSARHAAAVPAGMDAASWVNSGGRHRGAVLRDELYDHYKNSKAAQDSSRGFLAEEWAFGTANVDAKLLRRSTLRASGSTRTTRIWWMWPGADQYQLKF